MCGIAGIISLKTNNIDFKNKGKIVQKMMDQMRHRGPDETGINENDQYSVGTVRLKIVGGNQGRQPLSSEKKCLVFNGEIYNYKELAREYLSSNININSDTNILFQFLNKYGLKKLDCLNGMFSFCYVDKDYIYLVRDRFGKKPLYYTIKNGCLLFASEIKAFIGLIDFELKLPKFYSYLETTTEGKTIFKNIFEVKSSTYIKINRKNLNMSTHQYYSIFDIKVEKGSEKYLKEKLRWLVKDSIKIRTNTYLPYGVFISGGIDSSIIALLTKPQFLLTYLPQTNLIGHEESYADLVASQLPKSTYLKISPSKENVLEQLIQTVFFNGGPTTTIAAYAQYRLSEALSCRNIRLSFSGLGTDEFFNGYVRHAVSLIPKQYFDSAVFRGYETLINKVEIFQNSTPDTYANLLNRSSEIDIEFIDLITSVFSKTNSYPSAISICDALFTLPPLLHTDDHLNMAFGIESRAPFLDYRLVNFALGLPDDMKIKINSKGKVYLKYLLRETFKDILPKQIYLREDKIGFSSNINDLLRNNYSFLVHNSKAILDKNLPELKLVKSNLNSFQPYVRWEYQIVQIAITYLLYCRKYSPKEVKLILSKGDLYDRNN